MIGARTPAPLVSESLTPAPDGVLTSFVTSQRYAPSSVAVWVNGLRQAGGYAAQDGYHVVFVRPPRQDDVLAIQYNPA